MLLVKLSRLFLIVKPRSDWVGSFQVLFQMHINKSTQDGRFPLPHYSDNYNPYLIPLPDLDVRFMMSVLYGALSHGDGLGQTKTSFPMYGIKLSWAKAG